MRRVAKHLPILVLAACAPGGVPSHPGTAAATTLPGIHVEVEGVGIWMDTIPDRRFTTVTRNVRLSVNPAPASSDADGQQAAVFPAQRMAAIVAAVRERGGTAAVVRTRERAAPSGQPPLFGSYEYEVDVIRY